MASMFLLEQGVLPPLIGGMPALCMCGDCSVPCTAYRLTLGRRELSQRRRANFNKKPAKL